ncbi:MAG: hypothetical protein ABFR65_07870, partial [Pseudomonadota bacterium]
MNKRSWLNDRTGRSWASMPLRHWYIRIRQKYGLGASQGRLLARAFRTIHWRGGRVGEAKPFV